MAYTWEQFWNKGTLQMGSLGSTTVSWHFWLCGWQVWAASSLMTRSGKEKPCLSNSSHSQAEWRSLVPVLGFLEPRDDFALGFFLKQGLTMHLT